MERLRSALLALLLVLGWSAQHVAAAQVPVVYGLPLYGRVAADVASFSDTEVLVGYGNSRPKFASGQLQRTLARGGKFVRWGGPYIAGAMLVNDALNWFYQQAQATTPLGNWWTGTGFPPMTYYITTAGTPYKPMGEVICRGYSTAGLATVYHIGVFTDTSGNNSYFGIFNQYDKNGQNVSGRGGLSVKPSYTQVRDYLLANECKTLRPEPPLADIINANPGAGRQLADIMRRYLEANPDKFKTVVGFPEGVPNDNEIADDSVDCIIDTDRDGQTDCDELRRGPGVGGPGLDPQPGNRPGTDDGVATDPTDPNVKNPDTDKDGIPDWRDGDDDNDGFPDDKETPEGQKDPNIRPEPEEEPEEPEPIKCPSGYEVSSDGQSCQPVKDPPKCPEGYKAVEGADPPKCEKIPDEDPKDPPADTCGDFSLPRLMTHTAHYLRDVVFPCEPLDWSKIAALVTSKFPFSLVKALSIPTDSGSTASNPLPSEIGPFKLDFSPAAPFFDFIRLAFRALIWWGVMAWLINRLAGQVVLS